MLFTVFWVGGLSGLSMNPDNRIFFSKDNPQLLALETLEKTYSRDDNVYLVLAPKNKNVFTKENLIAIEELTAEAWNTPYSSRVDALTNYQHTRAEGDDLYVEDLSYESENLTAEKIEEINLDEKEKF